MEDDLSEEERKVAITKHLEALALLTESEGFAWVVVKQGGERIGRCSNSLEGYVWTLMEVVAKAAVTPIDVIAPAQANQLQPDTPPNARPRQRILRSSEKLLMSLGAKHVHVHPIAAAFIEGLNEINGHKIFRTEALKDSRTMPHWFPHTPDVYAARAQKMDLTKLFAVIDAVFDQIHRDLQKIRTLQDYVLKRAWDPLTGGVGTWAGIKCCFDALEQDAIAHSGGGAGPVRGGVENRAVQGGGSEAASESGMEIERVLLVASPGEPPDLNSILSPVNASPGLEPISPESVPEARRVRQRSEASPGAIPRSPTAFLGELDAQVIPDASPAYSPHLHLQNGSAARQMLPPAGSAFPAGYYEAPGSRIFTEQGRRLERSNGKNARQSQAPSAADPVVLRSQEFKSAAPDVAAPKTPSKPGVNPSANRSPNPPRATGVNPRSVNITLPLTAHSKPSPQKHTNRSLEPVTPHREPESSLSQGGTSVPRSLNITGLLRRVFGPQKGVLIRQKSLEMKGGVLGRRKSLKGAADTGDVDPPRALNLTHSAPAGSECLQPKRDDVTAYRRSNSDRLRRRPPVRASRGGRMPATDERGTPPGWESVPTDTIPDSDARPDTSPGQESVLRGSIPDSDTGRETSPGRESVSPGGPPDDAECEAFPVHRAFEPSESFKSEISVEEREDAVESEECENFPLPRPTLETGVNGHSGVGVLGDVALGVNRHGEGSVRGDVVPGMNARVEEAVTALERGLRSVRLSTAGPVHTPPVHTAPDGPAPAVQPSGTIVGRTAVNGTVASGTAVNGTAASGTVFSGTFASGAVHTRTSPIGEVRSGTIASGTAMSGKVAAGLIVSGTVVGCQLEAEMRGPEEGDAAADGRALAREDSPSSLDGAESPSSVLRRKNGSRGNFPGSKLFQTEADGNLLDEGRVSEVCVGGPYEKLS